MRNNESWNLDEIHISSEKIRKNILQAESLMQNDVHRLAMLVMKYNPLAYIRTACWNMEQVERTSKASEIFLRTKSYAFTRFLIKLLVSREFAPAGGFSEEIAIKDADWKKSLKYFSALESHTTRYVDNRVLSLQLPSDQARMLQEYCGGYCLPCPVDVTLLEARKKELRDRLQPFASMVNKVFDAPLEDLIEELGKLALQGYEGIARFSEEFKAYQEDLVPMLPAARATHPGMEDPELIKLIIREKGWQERDRSIVEKRDGLGLFMVKDYCSLSDHDCRLLSLLAGSAGEKDLAFLTADAGLDETLFINFGGVFFSFEGKFIFDRAWDAIKHAVLTSYPEYMKQWAETEISRKRLLPFSILAGVLGGLDYSFNQQCGDSYFDVVFERGERRVNVCISSCHVSAMPLNPFDDLAKTAEILEQQTSCRQLAGQAPGPLVLVDDTADICYPLGLDTDRILTISLLQLCTFVNDWDKIRQFKDTLGLPQLEVKAHASGASMKQQDESECTETQEVVASAEAEDTETEAMKPQDVSESGKNQHDEQKSTELQEGMKSMQESDDELQPMEVKQKKTDFTEPQDATEKDDRPKKTVSGFSFATVLQNVAGGKDPLAGEVSDAIPEETVGTVAADDVVAIPDVLEDKTRVRTMDGDGQDLFAGLAAEEAGSDEKPSADADVKTKEKEATESTKKTPFSFATLLQNVAEGKSEFTAPKEESGNKADAYADVDDEEILDGEESDDDLPKEAGYSFAKAFGKQPVGAQPVDESSDASDDDQDDTDDLEKDLEDYKRAEDEPDEDFLPGNTHMDSAEADDSRFPEDIAGNDDGLDEELLLNKDYEQVDEAEEHEQEPEMPFSEELVQLTLADEDMEADDAGDVAGSIEDSDTKKLDPYIANKAKDDEETDEIDPLEKELNATFDADLESDDNEETMSESSEDDGNAGDDPYSELDAVIPEPGSGILLEKRTEKQDMNTPKSKWPDKIAEIFSKLEKAETSKFYGICDAADAVFLAEMARVLEQVRLAQLADGKDKMFTVPDSDLTIVLTTGQDDLLRNWDRKNNVGAVMYSHGCEEWTALTLKYGRSGKLVRAVELGISKDDFQPIDWKFVVSTVERFQERKHTDEDD
ncbi:MAG: hypothetical protein LKE40_06590 [Spirochaetia bacterium]|jgi:hypothetical protein|nr:hypothetical protein [Spirochaetia bacterium]